ncbi:hypothetical protein PMAYCL1PPCAC_22370, partial [Pristionchus mayeri]
DFTPNIVKGSEPSLPLFDNNIDIKEESLDILEEPITDNPAFDQESLEYIDMGTRSTIVEKKWAAENGTEAANVNVKQVIPLTGMTHYDPIVSEFLRQCDLCYAKTNITYSVPADSNERSTFLNNLINVPMKFKHILKVLRNSNVEAFICTFHVMQYKSYDLPIVSDCPRKCHLCDAQTRVVYAAPATPNERSAFLNTLINVPEQHKHRVEALRNNTEEAFICISHILKFKGQVFDQLLQTPKCHLCDEMASSWLMTPEHPDKNLNFFENLIELDLDGLKKVSHLVNSNSRAVICKGHYREPLKSPPAPEEKGSRTEPTPIDFDSSNDDDGIEEPNDKPGPSRCR